MKNATFRQLRVFSEVARQLSFVRAAENLHLTPPAVTMQIKELESQVGMPLFDRSGKKVSLTTTGEYMVVYARKILALLKDAEDASARLQRAEIGLLTVGMVSTAKYFMMRLLADFRERHAGVDIRICTGNREQLVKMLHNNEVDIAVLGHPPHRVANPRRTFCRASPCFCCRLRPPPGATRKTHRGRPASLRVHRARAGFRHPRGHAQIFLRKKSGAPSSVPGQQQ